MEINNCPNCGSTYFEVCDRVDFVYLCECGAKFEVNFYDKDFKCE